MKRFLAFIFILSMFLTICIPIYAMEINEGYADIKGHWARTEVDKWSEKGLLKGSNGKFNPNNHITRAEMAVIIDRLMDYGETETNVFEDLSDTWYTEAILKNSRAGVMKGFDGYIRPMDSITRQEAVVMISRAMEIEEKSGNTSFVDDSMIASWAKGYVKAFSDLGYISGMPDGSFAPNRPVTRAAVVKIVDNMIAKWINEKGEYSEDINGILIINSEDVTLKDMTIDGNLIIAQGVAGGEIYLDNVTVTGDVFVKGGGENSVYFNDTKINGTLEVSKTDGRIRIVAKGSTVAKVTKLLTGAILVESYTTGIGFERVEVPKEAAENSDIDIEGDITILNVSAKGTNVNILKDTKVGRADLSAEGSKLNVLGEVNNVNINSGADDTSVIGSGKVTNVKVNANDVSVTTDKTKVTAGENVTGVTADGQKVNAGKTVKTGGTSSSGGSSSGGTTQPTNHAPTVVVGKESHTGTATPAHGSGTPMAVAYQIDVNSWFVDSDTSDTLTYAVASTTSSDAANIVINGSSLTYTPSFEDRDSNIEIQVKANDGIADSTTNAMITITVGSVPNSAPVPVNTTQTGNATPSSIDEMTAPVQPYIADMSAWFTDSDNDNLNYIVVSNTGDGAVNIINSTLEYVPSIADAGFNIDIVMKVNDGMTDSSDNVTVTVVVGAIPNSKPMLSNQVVTGTAISASRDGLISSTAYNQDLISYFTDVDSDTLTYRIVSENANGDVSLNGSTITFTPNTTDADSDITIIVKANDGTIDSDNLTITVEVDDVPNSSPVKDSDVPDYNSLIIGNAVNIDLSQHFSDADVTANADTLSYSINPSLPSGLTLNTSTGVISGTGSKMSQTSFTVTAKDSHNAAVTDEFDMAISLPVQGTKVRDDSGTWVIDDTNGTHIGLWSVEDLVKINENTGDFLLSGDYVLMTHLDFEEDDSYRDEAMADTKDIDGDNHTISNLYINRPGTEYIGLFGYSGKYTYNPTTPYTIKNIGLINPIVTGQASAAFISGGSNANIEGCYVEGGTLSSSGNYCGGIVGQAYSTFIRIKRCYVKDITINSSGAYVAGILARASSSNYLVE
ncbi:MAG: S-layer homology domain-containing protein, partial [Clostridia bacterium]|nr:S-layer homology domain-containing protein [Clostridia bacterium]